MIVGDTPFTTGDKLNNSRLLRVRYYLDSPSDATPRSSQQAGAVPGTGLYGPWAFSEGSTSYQVSLFDNPDGHFFVPVGDFAPITYRVQPQLVFTF
jgi:hypothetical protein